MSLAFITLFLQYLLDPSTYTLTKAALSYCPPFLFVGIRMVLGGTLMLIYTYYYHRKDFFVRKEHIGYFAQIAFFLIFVAFVTEVLALKTVTSAKTSLLFNLSPFVAAIFSYFWFAEKMTIKKFIGLTIGFCGFLPLLLADASSEGGTFFLGISQGEWLVFVSVISDVYGWVVFRKLARDLGYSPWMINSVGMISGGLLALITSFALEGWPKLILAADQIGQASRLWYYLANCTSPEVASFLLFLNHLLLLILIANSFCYIGYGYLLRKYSKTFLSFADFSTPLIAAPYGWFFLSEEVSRYFFLTTIIVFIGLVIFYKEEQRQGYISL